MNSEPQHGWCEALYRAKASHLLLYGRALGLSHVEAEDVLQESFVALMGLEQAPEQPERYCLRTFRNRALNFRRSLWRRLARECHSKHWFEPSPGQNPAELAAMQALEGLPREQREAIVLKIWHDYTFEEMGQLLELSPNTVAGRFRYGLQKLRATLDGDAYEQIDPSGTTTALLEPAPPLRET